MSAPPAKPRRSRTTRWAAGAVALAAIAAAVPEVLLQIGTRRAMTCVAAYREPRGPQTPDCRREIRWFVTPSRVPWTAVPARYRAEELSARIALADYTDALVGRPDREASARAAEGVEASARTIQDGSRRLALEELGPAVGAPDLGRSAELDGDRATLLARFDRWGEWHMSLRALEAAWIEGDPARAATIARRFAEFDPRDDELRTAVAATLCLGDDPGRGVAFFATVQGDRASQRHENWARDWGDVRAAMVACAARAGVAPPPLPGRADAGQGDAEEARAALRLRLLAAARPDDPATSGRVAEAAAATVALLRDPRPKGVRILLLAALLQVRPEPDAAELAELAAPKKDAGEAELAASPSRTALDWLDPRRGLEISVPAATLRRGAARLAALAKKAGLEPRDRAILEAAAAAAGLEAARTLAIGGDAAGAIEVLATVAAPALPGEEARALARSSAWYVAGDPARALAELDPLGSAAPLPDDAAQPAREVRAALLLQRAELHASLGHRDEAAKAAIAADDAAARSGSRALDVRARWTRAALATPPLDPLRDGTAARAVALAAVRARAWPWTGVAAAEGSWLPPEAEGAGPVHEGAASGPSLLASAIAFWSEARSASPEDRRALRYAAFGHRGDAPIAPVAYVVLASELLHPGEGDVELWLDAFTATDARRLPLRTYAWIRAEAARARGDTASASLWDARRRTLAAIAADPTRTEIARYLGL